MTISAGVELDAGSFPHPDGCGLSCDGRYRTPGLLRDAALLRLDLPFAVLDEDLAATLEGAHPGCCEAFFERMPGRAFPVTRRKFPPWGAHMLYHARSR